jgi:hypothetical protein
MPYIKCNKKGTAFMPYVKCNKKGTAFRPYVKCNKTHAALAAEGCLSDTFATFSAVCRDFCNPFP